MREAQLFGQHLWRTSGKRVIVTEGEIDAMSMSQVQDNKWPVVSVKNGANGAYKALQESLDLPRKSGAKTPAKTSSPR
jgi:twinkle protein